MDSYEKSSLKDEFCYRQYSDSSDNLGILPPVSEQGGDCTADALALVCAVEARYRKAQICPPLSMKDLLHNLQDRADKWDSDSFYFASLALGGSCLGLNTGIELDDDDDKVIEVMDDEETDDDEVTNWHQQKFGLSCIDNYTLVGKGAKETVLTMKFDDVVDEIRNNGPVYATFFPDWDFSYWSMEHGRNCIYEGLYLAELSGADKKKHYAHVVALVGFGSGEKKYFIAQNSYGLNWGDNGMFRLDPNCVTRVYVPIL